MRLRVAAAGSELPQVSAVNISYPNLVGAAAVRIERDQSPIGGRTDVVISPAVRNHLSLVRAVRIHYPDGLFSVPVRVEDAAVGKPLHAHPAIYSPDHVVRDLSCIRKVVSRSHPDIRVVLRLDRKQGLLVIGETSDD